MKLSSFRHQRQQHLHVDPLLLSPIPRQTAHQPASLHPATRIQHHRLQYLALLLPCIQHLLSRTVHPLHRVPPQLLLTLWSLVPRPGFTNLTLAMYLHRAPLPYHLFLVRHVLHSKIPTGVTL